MCVGVVAGSGETGSPHPKPLDYLCSSDEDIGGGGIALQALLFTLWVCTSTMALTMCFGWYPSRNLPE